MAALALASVVAVYRIDPKAINHDVACGEEEGAGHAPEALKLLFSNKPLLWFTAAITLFHFANAAMLPLAGEKLSQGKPDASPLFMASCVITAQLVMDADRILSAARPMPGAGSPFFWPVSPNGDRRHDSLRCDHA